MGNFIALLGLVGAVFASFSSSTHYQLQSYGVGAGGTNSSSSTHYNLQGNAGETAGAPTSSTHYTTKSGAIQAEQANVPPAPTLSNGSGTYYNDLGLIINTGGNPTDATYAVAVSSDNFVTTKYVQSDGSLGASQYFQTYTGWGGAGGSYITGLAPSTAYEVKVSAMTGKFTQSAYGPFASASTASPSITFSLSPSSQNIGTLLAGQIVTSGSNVNFNLSTNANYGGNIYVVGQYAGLFSSLESYTIPAYSGNLGTPSQGFGIQDVSASAPLAAVSPYNGTLNTVGGESTNSYAPLFAAGSPVASGTASSKFLAKASSTTPASPDYTEVLTFLAAASF